MIPKLLWRCPICCRNDALIHRRKLFRPELLNCKHCFTTWRVRRVPGDNFYLRISYVDDRFLNGDIFFGKELSVSEWYDRMLESVKLIPAEGTDRSTFNFQLGELLYLQSEQVALYAESTDPLVPASMHTDPADEIRGNVENILLGNGQLTLTNQRLVWQRDDLFFAFALPDILVFYDMLNIGIELMVRARQYMLLFQGESLIKWITYVDLVSKVIEKKTRHRIIVSNY